MRVAFVTGAAGGIGKAICSELLASGVAVAGVDLNEAALRALTGELRAADRFLPIAGDVTKMSSVLEAVRRVNEALGEVSVLVNNAGAISTPTLLGTEEQQWLGDIDLNLNGPWRCIRALQDQLMRTGSPQSPSVIINIASVNGLAIFGHPGYSVAKAGLIHLTKFCAVEFGKRGVRSVAICPGSVKTPVWQQRQRERPDLFAEVASWNPSRDICTPEDVARLVRFAAGEQAPLLNGAVITLDGGLSAGSDRLASLFAGEPL